MTALAIPENQPSMWSWPRGMTRHILTSGRKTIFGIRSRLFSEMQGLREFRSLALALFILSQKVTCLSIRFNFLRTGRGATAWMLGGTAQHRFGVRTIRQTTF